MRRIWIFFTLILLLSLACRAASSLQPGSKPGGPASAVPEISPSRTFMAPPTIQPTSSTTPTPLPSTPTPLPPTATATPLPPTPTPLTPTATPEGRAGFQVNYHPDGGLIVGDQVSLEVIAPQGADLKDQTVQVEVQGVGEAPLASEGFGRYGIGGRYQATLWWAWDTRGFKPGDYDLHFSIQPGGAEWTETVTLLPIYEAPYPEPDAKWVTTETDCCLVYTISGTEAERDLAVLEKMLDEQADAAARRLGTDFEEPVPVFFIPRVLGHGGFAAREISVSYLDRNYAGNDAAMVLHHEMIHILDGRLGGELRPSFLVEGLAVYLSGGHFKPEPLLPRAAALVDLGLYIPLATLAEDFYPVQHETGYLEAGSLIEYMVDTWGWDGFSAFYRDMQSQGEGTGQVEALEAALKAHFGLSLEDLEKRYLEVLRAYPLTPELRQDVLLTLRFYDTVRSYQQSLDPSAYFMFAWLPPLEEMRKRGIVADYLRHPEGPANLALETILLNADIYLRSQDYPRVEEALDAVGEVLDRMRRGEADPFAANRLAADTYSIVQALVDQGYEPQRIQVQGNSARVWATQAHPDLLEFTARRSTGRWELQAGAQSNSSTDLSSLFLEAAERLFGGFIRPLEVTLSSTGRAH